MSKFRVVFYWEQRKTDLGYIKDYIVDQASAAPSMESTTSSGIAADHRGMCRFESKSEQGFRNVVSELKSWAAMAEKVVKGRWVRSQEVLSGERRYEAEELLRGNLENDLSFPERRDMGENLMIEDPGKYGEDFLASMKEDRRVETLA